MTWNISASGPKSDVKAEVEKKVTGFHQHPDVTAVINSAIDATRGSHVSVSGSGYDQSFSLNISSWEQAAAQGTTG